MLDKKYFIDLDHLWKGSLIISGLLVVVFSIYKWTGTE